MEVKIGRKFLNLSPALSWIQLMMVFSTIDFKKTNFILCKTSVSELLRLKKKKKKEKIKKKKKKKKMFKERKDSKLTVRATTWNSFEVFLISSFPSKEAGARN